MRKIIYIISTIIFIAAVTVLSWFSIGSSIIAICATLLAVLYPKFESIVEISFGPLKAKLKRTITESENLIEGLRNLALAQSKALVSASAHTGRFAADDDWIFLAAKDIESGLRTIGASELELNEAISGLVKLTLRDLGAAATNGNNLPIQLGGSAVAEWREFRSNENLSNPDFIENWLKKYNVYSDDQRKIVEAMRWIIKNNNIRDSEQYMLAKNEHKLAIQTANGQ